MTHKERKYINNIPKYDIGKMPNSSGYLVGQLADLNSFTSSPGYDYSNDIKSQRQSNLLSGITLGASAISNIYQMRNNYTPTTIALIPSAANLGSLIQAGTATLKGGSTATMTGIGGPMKIEAAPITVEQTGTTTTTASGVTGALGKAAGILGAMVGTGMMINDFVGFLNRLTDNDILNTASKGTESKYGVTYNKYGGINEDLIKQYTNAQNTGGTVSAAINGLSAGASLGSLWGPIGMGIGGIAGGLTGLVGGLIGSSKRSSDVQNSIDNALIGMKGANLQAEAEAGSQGLRQQFNATHTADPGKVPDNGNIGGYMSPDETAYDPEAPLMDRVKYPGSPNPNVKDKREDVVPMPKNISKWSVIGHGLKIGNKYLADISRPFGKRAEQIKQEFINTSNPYELIRLMEEMKGIDNKVKAIANLQLDMDNRKQMKHLLNYKRINADKGKVPTFDENKNAYTIPTLTHMGLLATLLSTPTRFTPRSVSGYVPTNNSNALSMLSSLNIDPTYALDQTRVANRLNIYNTNQQGGLSSGQRLLSKNASNLSTAAQRSAIYNGVQELNNKYRSEYAQALMNNTNTNAERLFRANEAKIQRDQEAYGKAFDAKQARAISLMNTIGTMGKDYMNINQFNLARDYQNKLIDMYGANQALDEKRLEFEIENAKLANKPKNSYTFLPTTSYSALAKGLPTTFDLNYDQYARPWLYKNNPNYNIYKSLLP